MEFAKGLKVEPGSVLIFPDDKYVSKVEQSLKTSLSELKQHQAWQDFQDYVTFRDEELYQERSGQYRSQGGLNINIDFEAKRITDIDNKMRLNIIRVIETNEVKIVTIAGLFITKKLTSSFTKKAKSPVKQMKTIVAPRAKSPVRQKSPKSPSTSLPLTRDAFIVIARNSTPRDVARLCATNRQLENFCTPEFYRDMLWHHFGQKSKDPRKAFFHLIRRKVYVCGHDNHGQLGLGRRIPLEGDEDYEDDQDDQVDQNNFTRTPVEVEMLTTSIKAISAGDLHSLFLDIEGRVWGCGANEEGELGIPIHDQAFSRPTLIPGLKNIVAISTKSQHSLFLDSDGNVFGCGVNQSGQLGRSEPQYSDYPRLISLPKVRAISAGNLHSLFLDLNGQVWGCGSNTRAKLGFSELKSYKAASIIPRLPKMKAISAGEVHSLFLDMEGRVWGCGGNNYGQLGLKGSSADFDIITPTVIPKLPEIVAISAGTVRSLFLDVEGRVWRCGADVNGQTGPKLISNLPKIKAISSGHWYSLFLDVNGRVWGLGANNYGQLGIARESDIETPEMIKTLSDIKDISASYGHSLFLD